MRVALESRPASVAPREHARALRAALARGPVDDAVVPLRRHGRDQVDAPRRPQLVEKRGAALGRRRAAQGRDAAPHRAADAPPGHDERRGGLRPPPRLRVPRRADRDEPHGDRRVCCVGRSYDLCGNQPVSWMIASMAWGA